MSDKFAGLSDAERQSAIEQVDQTAVRDSKQVAAVQTGHIAHRLARLELCIDSTVTS